MSGNETDRRCAEHAAAAAADECDHCPDPWNCEGKTCRYGRVN